MNITVAFTVTGMRPKYLKAALDSWHAVRGVQQVPLLVRHEPIQNQLIGELREAMTEAFTDARVDVNPEWFGCARNTRVAMEDAFRDGADFAVLAEEDMIVSSDVLEYFAWAAQAYRHDPDVMAVSAHSFHGERDRSAVVRRVWFNPQMWGTWPGKWEQFISRGWKGIPGNAEAWDADLRERFGLAQVRCIFPLVSRVQHEGEVSTLTRMPLAGHFYHQFRSHSFEPDIPPQEYHEVEDPGPSLVV